MINLEDLEIAIIDAKQRYTNVYSTKINDDVFIWKLLNTKELEIINKTSAYDVQEREDLVCQYAVIFPKDIDFSNYKAGVPPTLAPLILEESGFTSADKIYKYLDGLRKDLETNFISQASVIIVSAFPQYTFNEVENWDIETFLDILAKAEWKFKVLDGRDFKLEKTKLEEETEEEKKEKLKKLEEALIQMGGDPILHLYEDYYKKEKKYTELPFIVGNNYTNKEVVNAVQQQLQKRSFNK